MAKTAAAHAALQRAMTAKDTRQTVSAVVYGRVRLSEGDINLRLRRDPSDRRRMVASDTVGAESLTRFERLARVPAPLAGFSLFAARSRRGVRIKSACIWPRAVGPLLATVYGEPRWSSVSDPELALSLRTFPRQALHAWRLAFTHPVTHTRLLVEAPVPRDLKDLLRVTGLLETGVDALLGDEPVSDAITPFP